MTGETEKRRESFTNEIRDKAERKSRAQRNERRGIWFGLGMFGLVGWSVAIPALLLLALGIWIDRTFSSGYSWTLMLLVLGIGLGCLNAWYWVSKESRED